MIWLLLIIFAELMLGSRDGALFSLEFAGFRITFRMALFALALVVWAASRRKIWPDKAVWRPWATLGAIVAWGIFSSLLDHNSARAIYQDANAYFFALLVLPILTLAPEQRERLQRWIEKYLPVLGLVVAGATVALALIFSYGLAEHGQGLYKLIRDLRIGELTPVLPDFTRVFIQSQLWLLPVWFLVVTRASGTGTSRATIVATVLATALMLSLSRSFWIGWVVGAIVLVAAGFSRRGREWQRNLKVAATSLLAGAALCIILFPSFPSAFVGRGAAGEPAASTRQAQIAPLWSKISQHFVLGAGFGSQVSFKSDDPRTSGLVTTSAFEWGYLDQWLDMGLLGLLAIICLIYQLIKKTRHVPWLAPSLVAVAVTHLTSPYLNHPLGLGILLLAAVYSKTEPITSR